MDRWNTLHVSGGQPPLRPPSHGIASHLLLKRATFDQCLVDGSGFSLSFSDACLRGTPSAQWVDLPTTPKGLAALTLRLIAALKAEEMQLSSEETGIIAAITATLTPLCRVIAHLSVTCESSKKNPLNVR